MKINLETLRRDNQGYAFGADALDKHDLKIVNDLIGRIESTRTREPQALDKIIYTDKYGGYYPNAMLEGDVYHDGLPCIVQHASAHVGLDDGGSIYLSSSGGVYDGKKDVNKFKYLGKGTRTFWTWSSEGPGASHGIYFDAEVSCFEYIEAPLPRCKEVSE